MMWAKLLRLAALGTVLWGLWVVAGALNATRPPANPPTRHIDWYYIVPNQYEGDLYIYYQCPGGQPLPVRGHRADVHFPPNGIFCVTDKFEANYGREPSAKFENGKRLTVTDQPRCAKVAGLVFCEIGIASGARRNNGNTFYWSQVIYNPSR